MRESLAARYESGTDEHRFASQIDLNWQINEQKVREAALDRAIQACGGRASAEELVASAKLFVAFIAGEQQ